MRKKFSFFMTLTLVFSAQGCVSTPKSDHTVRSLAFSSLRVRRPEGAPANPKEAHGGIDYRSHPLPNERMDCETVNWLFRGFQFAAIRQCLNGIDQEQVIQYRLKRFDQPKLVLDDPQNAPACIRELISEIPMPREIFFQDSMGSCYSSRLNIEADQLLGARIPTHRIALQIRLPLAFHPLSDDDLIRLLGSWALTPFWDAKLQGLKSKYVPESICRSCIGEREMNDPNRGKRLWPPLVPLGSNESEQPPVAN